MKKHLFLALLSLFSILYADTINSTSKNPSMAVAGIQRDSATSIQPWVIPVAVSGAACTTGVDTIAVTSDHSSQLICQSGTWQSLGGGSDIATKTTNGQTILPSGLTMKWGIYNPSASTGTITFPTPFPTATLNVSLTMSGAASFNWPAQITSFNKNGISFYIYAPTYDIYYIAIGY